MPKITIETDVVTQDLKEILEVASSMCATLREHHLDVLNPRRAFVYSFVSTRGQLAEMYRDYLNNYLSNVVWAEHMGLSLSEAIDLLKVAKSCHDNPNPEN